MKEKKTTHKGLSVWFLIGGLLLLPSVSAQDPPVEEKECISYAYTESQNHLFLLGQNSSMFGSKLNVIHNCQDIEIYIDGIFEASSTENFAINIDK